MRPAGVEEAQGTSKDGGYAARSAAMVASAFCAHATPRARESEAEGENERDGESRGRRLPFYSSREGKVVHMQGCEGATWPTAPTHSRTTVLLLKLSR